jgi:hypothetical protein
LLPPKPPPLPLPAKPPPLPLLNKPPKPPPLKPLLNKAHNKVLWLRLAPLHPPLHLPLALLQLRPLPLVGLRLLLPHLLLQLRLLLLVG